MTAEVDIVNRALQSAGTRTNVTSAELTAAFAGSPTSNEAREAALVLRSFRDQLIRMAPWQCVTRFNNLVYITSVPTTPENASSGPPLWSPGTPPPPWAYEYQYPVDCLRARWIIPQYTSQAGGVPIFPPGTVTGAAQVGWTGPALKFTISTDQFFGVTSAAVLTGGINYLVGDLIVLSQPTFTIVQGGQSFPMPVGAPAVLQVTGASGGVISSVAVVNQIQGESTPIGGSYFSPTGALGTQGSTTGTGSGATFALTFSSRGPQRVVLCNQESAILCYNTQITDPNVMDPNLQEAWTAILAARLSIQLNGDKALANIKVGEANSLILEARKTDGNEEITVNDVTPDFLRVRGNWGGPNWEYSPNMGFDWGSTYSPY
jgi:hypothetical protein